MKKGKPPWLALLLFDEDELEVVKKANNEKQTEAETDIQLLKKEAQLGYIIDLKHLKNNDLGDIFDSTEIKSYPEISEEQGQDDKDKTSVIFVKKETLEKLLPSREELRYLAHTRKRLDGENQLIGEEKAIIIGNRLPKAGATSIIHLVSMENRYKGNSFDFLDAKEGTDLVPLVSLKSWKFSSLSHRHTFRGLLLQLNQTQLFRVPLPADLSLQGRHDYLPPELRNLFVKMGLHFSR